MAGRKLIKYVSYAGISLCGALMTLTFAFLRTGSPAYLMISMAASFLIFAFLCFRLDMPAKLLGRSDHRSFLVAAVLACMAVTKYCNAIHNLSKSDSPLANISSLLSIPLPGEYTLSLILSVSVCVAGFFILLWFVQWFIGLAKDFISSLDSVERIFLISAIALLAVSAFIIYSATTVFYYPLEANGTQSLTDALFNSDAGIMTFEDTFASIKTTQNDVRNILFGVVNMPFGLFAHFVSWMFLFVPFGYPYCITLIQGTLLLSGLVMLEQMMGLERAVKLPFLLIMCFSFQVILNLLNIEQYSLSVFWVIVLAYSYVNRRDDKVLCFIGAAGSTITSGVLLPLITEPGRAPAKQVLKDLLRAFLIAVCLFTVFGYIYYFTNTLWDELSLWVNAAQGASLTSKLQQVSQLMCSLFVMPPSGLSSNEWARYAFDVLPVTSLNLCGCVLFALAIVGFMLNRKMPIARIFASWILLSIFILIIVGWGAAWNCMTLYGLYFAWAYIPLMFFAVDAALKRLPRGRVAVLYVIAAALLVTNAVNFYRIISFGVEYYPFILDIFALPY